jgi:DNA-binding response OmpR family regulator
MLGWSRHSSRQPTILIVTQDIEGFRSVRLKLETARFRLLDTSRGEQAIALIQAEGPDLVLLDRSLPDVDGLTVCERVRRFSRVPIIIVTEERSERAKIRGFTAGADDYLIKPVGARELLARVRAVLRRTEVSGVFKSPPPVRLNGFEIDPLRHEIRTPRGKVKLTPTERHLLYYLASNAGRVLTHEQLLTKVWGPGCDYPTEHLWVNISRLRKKIEPDPSQPYYIITEPGVGYYFRKPKGPSS